MSGAGEKGLATVPVGMDVPAAWAGLVRTAVPRGPHPGAPTVERLMRAELPAVGPDDGLAAVAARMRCARVGALPVLDAGRLVGLITERDLLMAVADGLSTDVVRVSSYMRPAPAAIGPEASAAEAAAIMVERRTSHLPVLRRGEVVGLVAAVDVLREWGIPRELLDDERS